jgi:hypothetical protein
MHHGDDRALAALVRLRSRNPHADTLVGEFKVRHVERDQLRAAHDRGEPKARIARSRRPFKSVRHCRAAGIKEKIVLCVCAGDDYGNMLFFWFNTDRARHGIGQLPVQPTQAPGLTHDCFLDLSRVTTFPPAELKNAEDRGTASRELLFEVINALSQGIRTLTQRQTNSVVSSLFACIETVCVQLPEDTGENDEPIDQQ